MKKVLLIALVAVFGLTSVNAQDENTTGSFAKGDVFISGTASFSSVSFAGTSADAFTIAPSAGYFINENIALGLSVSYSDATLEFDGDDISVSTFGGGVFGRYYLTPSNQFSFFGNVGIGYSTADMAGVDLNTISAAFAPGISYFVSDCIAIEAAVGVLGYSSSKFDAEGEEAINTLINEKNTENNKAYSWFLGD